MEKKKKGSIEKQYRGTVILDTTEGILVNAMETAKFLLPGGASKRKKGESRLEAAVRELREETHLHACLAIELFEYEAPPYTEKNFQDYHKVFYVKARGRAKPGKEVKHIGYYKPGMDLIDGRQISGIHVQIIEKYFEMRRAKPELFKMIDELFL